MAQTLVPFAMGDFSNDGLFDSLGFRVVTSEDAAAVWATADGTYLWMGVGSAGGGYSLSPGTDPLSSTGHVISVRISVTNITGPPLDVKKDVTVTLIQVRPLLGNVTIVTYDIPWGSLSQAGFTTHTHTLSGAEADAITDYEQLEIRLTTLNGSSGTGTAEYWVDYVALDIPGTPPPTPGLQLSHATADIAVNGLTDQFGWSTTNPNPLIYYTEIDETPPVDTDYIRGGMSNPRFSHPDGSTTGPAQIRFGGVTDSGIDIGYTCSVRFRWQSVPLPPPGSQYLLLRTSFCITGSIPKDLILSGSFAGVEVDRYTALDWHTVTFNIPAWQIEVWRFFQTLGFGTDQVGTFAEPFLTFEVFWSEGAIPADAAQLVDISWAEIEIPAGATTVTITGAGGMGDSGGIPGGGFDLSGFHLAISGGNPSGPSPSPGEGCIVTVSSGADSGGGAGCLPDLPGGSDSGGDTGCGVVL